MKVLPERDPKDVEIEHLKDRVKTLEMVVRGYEEKAINYGHFHRISMLRSAFDTLAAGQCLDTARQHAQAALNADYNISLRELANLPGQQTMMEVECNGKVRAIKDMEIIGLSGCSIVNNGHEDLFDLGFTNEELKGLAVVRPKT